VLAEDGRRWAVELKLGETRWLTSGGRFVHTFSKVCISLQSVHLAEKMHTFFDILQTFCRLSADFF